jgi:hypothetical protein
MRKAELEVRNKERKARERRGLKTPLLTFALIPHSEFRIPHLGIPNSAFHMALLFSADWCYIFIMGAEKIF